jgi:hypothetical protein
MHGSPLQAIDQSFFVKIHGRIRIKLGLDFTDGVEHVLEVVWVDIRQEHMIILLKVSFQ